VALATQKESMMLAAYRLSPDAMVSNLGPKLQPKETAAQPMTSRLPVSTRISAKGMPTTQPVAPSNGNGKEQPVAPSNGNGATQPTAPSNGNGNGALPNGNGALITNGNGNGNGTEEKPWYKKPVVWGITGGGIVAIAAVVLFLRR
jgi:hypothetical protein